MNESQPFTFNMSIFVIIENLNAFILLRIFLLEKKKSPQTINQKLNDTKKSEHDNGWYF